MNTESSPPMLLRQAAQAYRGAAKEAFDLGDDPRAQLLRTTALKLETMADELPFLARPKAITRGCPRGGLGAPEGQADDAAPVTRGG